MTPSFLQCYALVQRLMPYPALTLMVTLRRDLGYRILNPFALSATFGILAMITILATPGHEAGRPYDLLMFFGIAFLNGIAQRICCWRRLNRNDIQQHSYYIGDSPFNFRWLPNFMRRNRRVARYIDPLLCALIGVLLLPYSQFLAIWLIFAGFCLRACEHMAWSRERNRDLDMMDSLSMSQHQAQTLDRFEQGPNAQPQPDEAIPTGIGEDIHAQIKQRKAASRST